MDYALGIPAGSNGTDAACVGSCCAGVVDDEGDDDPLRDELSGAPDDDAAAPLFGTGPPEGSKADPVTSRTAHFPCTYRNRIWYVPACFDVLIALVHSTVVSATTSSPDW